MPNNFLGTNGKAKLGKPAGIARQDADIPNPVYTRFKKHRRAPFLQMLAIIVQASGLAFTENVVASPLDWESMTVKWCKT